jgi:hypothetical protein
VFVSETWQKAHSYLIAYVRLHEKTSTGWIIVAVYNGEFHQKSVDASFC